MKNILFQLEHGFITLLLTSIGFGIGYFYRQIILGSIIGSIIGMAFFFGREHAQAEYRWIEHYGHGLRANMPWWATLDLRVWDFHSWFWNLTFPILIGVGFDGVVICQNFA